MRQDCAICGAPMDQRPTEATDPERIDGSWYEIYECGNGHKGRIDVNEPDEADPKRRLEYSGALRPDQELIV